MKTSYQFLFPVILLLAAINGLTAIAFADSRAMPFTFYHGISSVILLIVITILFGWQKNKLPRSIWLATLALITINCFSLNKDIGLFSPFSHWVYGYLGGVYAILILFYEWKNPPEWLRVIANLTLGAGIVMAFYFSICMLPLIPIGFMALLALGIGIHVFAPVMLLATLIQYTLKDEQTPFEKKLLLAGMGAPISVAIFFAITWNATNIKIKQSITQGLQNKDLPVWVNVAQHLPKNSMTKRLLTADFQYDLFETSDHFFNVFGRQDSPLENGRIHDPLINIAHLFTGDTGLSQEDRIKILQTTMESRHQTERKLWTGRDLSIPQMETNIEIYPEYRFAYTEKTIFIKNNARYSWDQQEALFTFYLPEGSTATSLSLWVNGKEEKSRLTTREKADSAYVAIVGVERRDPALLHWQEGNRLTLTVFPCTPTEERQVKIGFTTPLRLENQQLHYQNIQTKGPIFSGTNHLNLTIIGDESPIKKPHWLKVNNGQFHYNGRQRHNWEITFDVPEIPNKSFSFNNNCYHLEAAEPSPITFDPSTIYLDINAAWTPQEVEELYHLYQDQNIFVYNNQLIQITPANEKVVLPILLKRRFSIFPMYYIKNPEQSLLITKEGKGTPYLGDFPKEFQDKNEVWAAGKDQLKVYCLSKDIPGYLERFTNSSKCITYQTNTDGIREWSGQKVFPQFSIVPFSTNIEENELQIIKTRACHNTSKAPDHLLRLYNYNAILERSNLNQTGPEDLIELANEAFVVSPISSMIVLETIKDYERFGIDENQQSLQNAKTNGAGAVPEPHEWALILLTALILIVAYRMNWLS